jgi:4-carboxymuconolactone decarboxylase
MTNRPPGPRISPPSDPSPDAQATLAKGLHYRGQPLNVPATLAHHPLLLRRFTLFAGAFLAESSLPARDRELLTLRSAYRSGAEYDFGHHTLLAPEAGLTPDEIAAVTDPDHPWSPREALLMALADHSPTARRWMRPPGTA